MLDLQGMEPSSHQNPWEDISRPVLLLQALIQDSQDEAWDADLVIPPAGNPLEL